MSFAPGDAVTVSARSHDGHHRTPGYLKGRAGTITRVHGTYRNPETRAYGGDGLPEERLYLVCFAFGKRDQLLADVFEHWLEPTA